MAFCERFGPVAHVRIVKDARTGLSKVGLCACRVLMEGRSSAWWLPQLEQACPDRVAPTAPVGQGFAFVRFGDSIGAATALNTMHGAVFQGRPLVVKAVRSASPAVPSLQGTDGAVAVSSSTDQEEEEESLSQ